MSVSSRRLANSAFVLTFVLINVLVNAGLTAEVIIGNLSGSSTSVHSFDSAATLSLGVTIGASSVILEGVSLRLKAQDFSGAARLFIFDDNAGNPGSVLLADSGVQTVSSGSFSDYSFAPVIPPVLLANTTYWLTIGTTISASNALMVAADSTLIPPTGSFAAFRGLRFDDGDAITNLDSSPVPSFQINGVVSGVAVSEPAYMPFITAVGGLMFYLRTTRPRRLT